MLLVKQGITGVVSRHFENVNVFFFRICENIAQEVYV